MSLYVKHVFIHNIDPLKPSSSAVVKYKVRPRKLPDTYFKKLCIKNPNNIPEQFYKLAINNYNQLSISRIFQSDYISNATFYTSRPGYNFKRYKARWYYSCYYPRPDNITTAKYYARIIHQDLTETLENVLNIYKLENTSGEWFATVILPFIYKKFK